MGSKRTGICSILTIFFIPIDSFHSRKQKCRCHADDSLRKADETPWLFSRLSGGWLCGVHADWTQLTGCVDRVLDEADGEPRRRR